MKLIIAGSRGLLVFSDFIEALCNFHRICIDEVVSGTAAGLINLVNTLLKNIIWN
jgi:hypothetical protein